MCIRDRPNSLVKKTGHWCFAFLHAIDEEGKADLRVHNEATCLLYTSDAADDLLCVDLGGRRIIQKKKKTNSIHIYHQHHY